MCKKILEETQLDRLKSKKSKGSFNHVGCMNHCSPFSEEQLNGETWGHALFALHAADDDGGDDEDDSYDDDDNDDHHDDSGNDDYGYNNVNSKENFLAL